MTPSSRFWKKVDMHGPIPEHRPELGPCWIWRGHRIKKGGYGRLTGKKGTALVHKMVWENLLGTVPLGMCLDHLCRVTNCVNPAHMEVVTPEENTRRGLPFRKVQTHCKRGHPLSGANLYIGTGGRRTCRICHAQKSAESIARRRERFRTSGLTWNGQPYKDREQTRQQMSMSAKRRWAENKNCKGSLAALAEGRHQCPR